MGGVCEARNCLPRDEGLAGEVNAAACRARWTFRKEVRRSIAHVRGPSPPDWAADILFGDVQVERPGDVQADRTGEVQVDRPGDVHMDPGIRFGLVGLLTAEAFASVTGGRTTGTVLTFGLVGPFVEGVYTSARGDHATNPCGPSSSCASTCVLALTPVAGLSLSDPEFGLDTESPAASLSSASLISSSALFSAWGSQGTFHPRRAARASCSNLRASCLRCSTMRCLARAALRASSSKSWLAFGLKEELDFAGLSLPTA